MTRVWAAIHASLLLNCLLIEQLQVLPHHESIMATRCSVTLARSGPPNLLDYGLQIHLIVHFIPSSKWIFKLAWLWPLSFQQQLPPCLLNYILQVHLQSCSSMASKCTAEFTRFRSSSRTPNSLDHRLQVHLWSLSISTSQCISKLMQSWPTSATLSFHDHYMLKWWSLMVESPL